MVFGSNLVVLTFSPVNPTIFYLFPRNIVNLQPGVYPRSTWVIDYDYYLLPVYYLTMNILSTLFLLEISQSKDEILKCRELWY